MAFQVNGKFGGSNAYTITGLINYLRVCDSQQPSDIRFNILPGTSRDLWIMESDIIEAPEIKNSKEKKEDFPKDEVVRCFGLLSCASLIMQSSETGAVVVYHANAGGVAEVTLQGLLMGINSRIDKVYTIYAHQNSHSTYDKQVAEFESWGMKSKNIIQIKNLFLNRFGVNNHFQLGY